MSRMKQIYVPGLESHRSIFYVLPTKMMSILIEIKIIAQHFLKLS